MKRFILFIMLFVMIPLGSFITICELLIRRIPTEISVKNDSLERRAGDIRVLVLGASRAECGINPEYFFLNGYNAAHGSQSLEYDWFIFNKFIDAMDSVKYVIMDVSYHSLTYNLSMGGAKYRASDYHAHLGSNFNPLSIEYNLMIYNNLNIGGYKKIVRYLLYDKSDPVTFNDYGATTGLKKDRFPDWDSNEKGIARVALHSFPWNERVVNRNIEFINDIIKKCKKKNVQIILIVCPTWHTYYNNLNETQWKMVSGVYKSFARAHDNVYLLNLLKDVRFNKDDFFNNDHVNEYGQKKLSAILNECIVQ